MRLKDVADAAGVSEATASRVLAGVANISDETRKRVMAAAEDIGYAPRRKQPAAALGNDRKGLVGVVVAALQNSFYPYLIDHLHNELDMLGFDMILIIDELSSRGASRKIQSLIDTSLSGVIMTTASIDSPAVELLTERGIPTVLAIRSNNRGNVPVVESDNRMAGAEALNHLVELGHQKVGFILGPRYSSTAVGRFEGGAGVLAGAGFPVRENLVIWSEFTHQAGYSGFIQLMQRRDRPTAIFCGNDVMAIGALDAARKLGIQVPGDVSIIGVDDIPMASWSMISLSTIRQPIAEIGTLAARRIAELISNGSQSEPSHDILPTSLVRRSTTGPAAGNVNAS